MLKLLVSLIFSAVFSFLADITNQPPLISIISAKSIHQNNHVTQIYGPAIIKKNDITISANYLEYNNKTGWIKAQDSVLIIHDLNVYKADSITLNNTLTEGTAEYVTAWLKDKYKISTKKMKLSTKEPTSAEYCSMSTCNQNPYSKKFLWKIKAKNVLYDKEKENIIYKDVFFEFLEFPIFFLPYFSHASPKVKKRSGFLFPRISYSRNLGLIVIPKYYFSIADNAEAIFKPILSGKHSILWGDFHALFPQADLSLTASFQTNITTPKTELNTEEKAEYKLIKERGYRGHINGKYIHFIDDKTTAFINLDIVSDKTYLALYSFLDPKNNNTSPGDNLAESNIGVENIDDNHYFVIKAITYQNTRLNNTLYKTPNIIPYVENDCYVLFNNNFASNMLYSNIITMNVDYKNDKKDRKIYLNCGYLIKKHFTGGNIITAKFDIISNMYDLKKYFDESEHELSKSLYRIYPTTSISYTLPLLAKFKNGIFQLVTPRIDLVLAPKFKEKHQSYIEHSDLVFNYLEINNSNIFNENKTSTINQINTGNKIIYGVDSMFYKYGKNIANYYIFHSYQFTKKHYEIPLETGYRYQSSSVLTGGNMTIYDFNIGTDLTLKKNLNGVLRSKYYTTYTRLEHFISIGIFFGTQYTVDNKESKFKSIFTDFCYNINPKFNFIGNLIIGKRSKILRAEAGLLYEDECFSSIISIERTNYRKIDAKPDIRIHFTFHIKGIN